MIRRLSLVAVLIAALTLTFTAVANASLTTSYTFNGHGGYSADGLGQNGPGGTLQAEVPAGSTVQKAFLYGTYYFVTDPDLDAADDRLRRDDGRDDRRSATSTTSRRRVPT